MQELGNTPEILGIGIDRIDYTKGIPDRLQAIDRLLEDHPAYVGRLRFLQVGVPSRTAIEDYELLDRELIQQVEESTGNGGTLPGNRSLSFTGTSTSKRSSPCI